MSAAASPLLFDWPAPERRKRAIVLFLVASVLLHALCFYIFQVVYSPTVALLTAPARISIISPDDPESLSLLRWVEAEDPALASTTQRPPDYRPLTLPQVEQVPSYAQHQPVLRTIPEAPVDLSIPSSAAIGSSPRLRAAAAPAVVTKKTAVAFSQNSLGSPVVPEFTFHLSRADAPANAHFRLGVDENGAPRFCFLTESSGDPQLDEQARQFLLLCRFPKLTTQKASLNAEHAALTWSEATILWGNDFAPFPSATPAQ